MNSLINLGNLGAPQVSPAAQGLAGQTASQGDGSSLFSALLMQHIGPNLSNAGDAEALPNPGQNFSANAELARLLPVLLAQTKDSKSSMPANRQTDNPAPSSDDNPALAIWIASMAAMQMQPNLPTAPSQFNGLPSQLNNTGADQNSALQALEQQFPGLVSALTSNHFADGKSQTGKADTKMIGADAKQADVNPADVKAADPKVVDVKAGFDAALNAVQTAEPKKSDVQQPPVHVNADVAPIAQKVSAISDVSKIDPKSQMTSAAEKVNQPQLTPVAPQAQNSDTKSQSQSQPQSGDNHTNNQAKKDSTSTTQGQQTANQTNGAPLPASTTSTVIDQSNFAAMTQAATHNVPANAPNHPVTPDATQAVNVRDIGSVVATDPAPRIVPTARLMEAAGQAEMKVSVKSDVGTVDVRAVLEGGNISATVAAQHSGTRDWMMSNMHELQNTLSRDDLNLKTFEVTDSGLQNSGNEGQPKQQEQQQRNNSTYSSFATETHSSTASLDDIGPQETASRALSLLA
jgi:Flagellar hook-length control protein FliK